MKHITQEEKDYMRRCAHLVLVGLDALEDGLIDNDMPISDDDMECALEALWAYYEA